MEPGISPLGALQHDPPGAAGAEVDLAARRLVLPRSPPLRHVLARRMRVEHELARRIEDPRHDDLPVAGVSTVNVLPLAPIAFPLSSSLELAQVLVQPVVALFPEPPVPRRPLGHFLERLRPPAAPAATAARRLREIRPARSSTFRCFETAGSVMANGSASSVTEASPVASRARIARRVGSASAANVRSS